MIIIYIIANEEDTDCTCKCAVQVLKEQHRPVRILQGRLQARGGGAKRAARTLAFFFNFDNPMFYVNFYNNS